MFIKQLNILIVLLRMLIVENSITQRYFTNCNFNREIDSGSSQSDISSTGFEFLEKKRNQFCSQVKL